MNDIDKGQISITNVADTFLVNLSSRNIRMFWLRNSGSVFIIIRCPKRMGMEVDIAHAFFMHTRKFW